MSNTGILRQKLWAFVCSTWIKSKKIIQWHNFRFSKWRPRTRALKCAKRIISIFVMVPWPTFRQYSGAYICQMHYKLSTLAKAYLHSLGFPSIPLVWGKLLPVDCAQDNWSYPKNAKNAVFIFGSVTLLQFPDFFTIAPSSPPLWRFAAEIVAIRRHLVTHLGCVTSIPKIWSFYFGLERPRADRGLSRPTGVFCTTISVQNFIQIGWDLAVRGPKTCLWVKTENDQHINLDKFLTQCVYVNEYK